MKIKEAKNNETRVCQLLNKMGKFELIDDEFCPYDIIGEFKGIKTYVEVKKRRHKWDTFYIEKQKIDTIVNLMENQKDAVMGWLILSLAEGDFIFDIYQIKNYPIKDVLMNTQTAIEFPKYGEKKILPVFEFPFDLHFNTLNKIQ